MKTQYYTATSLDGFIATEDDSLDELIIQVGSATLGRGKPLFPRRVLSPTLHLISARRVGGGMAELRYEVPRDRGDEPGELGS